MILPWLLRQTRDDKRGVEALLARASSSSSHSDSPPMPSSHVVTRAQLEAIRSAFLPDPIILRSPALGEEVSGVENEVRVGEELATWKVSRQAVGRWIAREGWKEEYQNRAVMIGF